MPAGRWRDRFLFALKTSLEVLEPHRVALRALTPSWLAIPEEGIFAAGTAFSRLRVQRVFEQRSRFEDAPKPPLAEALGRLLYLVHLAVLLWWLLDKSPDSVRRRARLARLSNSCRRRRWPFGAAGSTFRHPVDELIREALFRNPASA